MTALNSLLILSFGIAFAAAAFMAIVALRASRARRRARRRLVEQPNSHYTSTLVREGQTRHRWHDIDLDRIHEINREEVVRLLARLEGASADALKPAERTFLDHMADLTGARARQVEPRDRTRPLTPDLQHRPA